jgi:hypothetical protein
MQHVKTFRAPLAIVAIVVALFAFVQLGAQSPATTVNAKGYLVNGVKGVGSRMHASPVDQTGNATATLKMNGLGAAAAPCTITPTSSGNVTFTISGALNQNTTADGVTYALAIGTGTAPANAAAATGTIISATPIWTALTGMLTVPFSVTASSTNLPIGVAQWYDLQVADVTGGTATIKFVDCTAIEN